MRQANSVDTSPWLRRLHRVGIGDGDRVRVFSPVGEVEVAAALSDPGAA